SPSASARPACCTSSTKIKHMTSTHWTWVGGAVACLMTGSLSAAPWFEPGDAYARFKLQQGADRGLLEAAVTTWPLARSHAKWIRRQNGEASVYLWNDLAAPLGGRASLTVSGGSDPQFIRGFADRNRDTGEVDLSL